MNLHSLQESVKISEIENLSKGDVILNLKYFQTCFLNEQDPQNKNKFNSSRGDLKNITTNNFQNKQNFSKQKNLKKSFKRSKSQQLDKTDDNDIHKYIDAHAKKLPKQSKNKDKEPGQFVPEGMDIDNLISIIKKDEIRTISTKNMLDLEDLEKINEIMILDSDNKKSSIKKTQKETKIRQPKPSIDITQNQGIQTPPESPQEFEKDEKFTYPKESFKMINSDQMKEDIHTKQNEQEDTSIKNSRLELDLSEIEDFEDTLINPLDDILNEQNSVKSEEMNPNNSNSKRGFNESSSERSKDKSTGSDSMSEDDEMDFTNPDFKFIDYMESKTKKLYTKREIKANISWSSTEYDIYNPEFTDDESVEMNKSVISDQFYLDSENEVEEKESTSSGTNIQNKKMKQFKVVLETDPPVENSEDTNSIINITDCSKGIKISISSSTIKNNSDESYVKIGSGDSKEDKEEDQNQKLANTHDFRDLLKQNDKTHTRNNKHFISLKKIKEKGKTGIDKKWGQFLTKKVKERMKRDSELSGKEQVFPRPPYTNRIKKNKNPLNASLNISNQPKLPNHKINFSFHSRYKDEINSINGTKKDNKYNRSKNSSLVRGSRSKKKRYKSRKSSHCLKTGLFGFINNTDNIYSVQNRRITIDSADSKNKSFFPSENFHKFSEDQIKYITHNQLNVHSTLGKTTSKKLVLSNCRKSEFVQIESSREEKTF